MTEYVGRRVRIKKNQGLIGGDKYPGRFGTIIKEHPIKVPQLLFYVALEPTARAKERVDAFWLSTLIFLDED